MRAARARGWQECRDAACVDADVVVYAGVADPPWDAVRALAPTARVSRFPGMSHVTEKDVMVGWLRDAGVDMDATVPETWTLPEDAERLAGAGLTRADDLIVKPANQRGGQDIRLVTGDAVGLLEGRLVVQRYEADVCTWRGAKFDLRMYVILEDDAAYLVDEAMVRLCLRPYARPDETNRDDVHVHLTNTAINKDSKYELHAWLADAFDAQARQDFLGRVDALLARVVCAMRAPLAVARRETAIGCRPFQILGVDVLVRADHVPVLVEINANPSLLAPTETDWAIKGPVVAACFDLLDGKQPANVRLLRE